MICLRKEMKKVADKFDKSPNEKFNFRCLFSVGANCVKSRENEREKGYVEENLFRKGHSPVLSGHFSHSILK